MDDVRHLPLRAALVGCGRWGMCIARTLEALPDFALRWVCDPRVRREPARWAPLLTPAICREVDVVLIATPADAHVQPARLALLEGKPTFVEKPFTTSHTDALELALLPGARHIMVGHLLVYHPAYQALLALVSQGSIGRVVQVEVERHSPARGEVARCPWWTLAPHDLSILTRLLGTPKQLSVRRIADGQVHALLTWPRASARLRYSASAETKLRTTRVLGSHGWSCVDELNGELSAAYRGVTRRVDVPAEEPLARQLVHFAHSVRNGSGVESGLADGILNVRLLELGQRSMDLRADVAVADDPTGAREPSHVCSAGSAAAQ